MLSVNIANVGILMIPSFWPSKILTPWGYCSVQEIFRRCDDWEDFQGLTGVSRHWPMAWVAIPDRTSEAWRNGATTGFSSCLLASLLRLWLSVILSVASIPWLNYSFLYLWLSSHGILYKCAFLQKHSTIFLTSQIPKGLKNQYPSVTGMAILWHLFTLKQPASSSLD